MVTISTINTDKKQEVIKLIHQEELLNTINTAEKSGLINRYNYSFTIVKVVKYYKLYN